MKVQELNTVQTVCELDRNLSFEIPEWSIQKPQFAVFILTGNCSNLLFGEDSTANFLFTNLQSRSLL